ncbi:hypothetical protein JUJ52_03110 [Virgibacillus sp. AGTR]|uniref:hypothetical protein n=1 Tax=Virgibacillus sp. AGTR TaxID=2812055 RepID=UPI001D166F71|nr:hypothetical protein [Virgibacillus sp. AGTR]MCC2248947.1 hypothetical protein [Virgibacillus sp. AGTR]
MNTRDTSKKTDKNKENDDLQTIEHKSESSPAFETDIDPITVLKTLNNHIEILHNNPSKKDVQRVHSELTSMEILTIEHGDETWWINEPLSLHRHVMRRPMSKRIGHLLKTKGEWKGEYVHKDNIEVKARVYLPIDVAIQPKAEAGIKNGEISTLLLSVIGLHNIIESMLEAGASFCGIFRKPDGVIHMNKLKMWLKDNENYGTWSMKDELNMITLYDIVNTATLTTNQ